VTFFQNIIFKTTSNVQVVSSVYFCRERIQAVFSPILKHNKNIKIKVYIMFRRKWCYVTLKWWRIKYTNIPAVARVWFS